MTNQKGFCQIIEVAFSMQASHKMADFPFLGIFIL
jgi:hypothetical protein